MPVYEVIVEINATETVLIEAVDEDDARRRYMDGEFMGDLRIDTIGDPVGVKVHES